MSSSKPNDNNIEVILHTIAIPDTTFLDDVLSLIKNEEINEETDDEEIEKDDNNNHKKREIKLDVLKRGKNFADKDMMINLINQLNSKEDKKIEKKLKITKEKSKEKDIKKQQKQSLKKKKFEQMKSMLKNKKIKK
nr:625_t:CDS:2 [Entrophospora candida]